MRFTKMHGIGNDFVCVNGFVERVANPAELARKICDRHFGVGADGLILIVPSEIADVRMRMFNADGTESEMCGNGIRCVAKLAHERGLTKRNPMEIDTARGVLMVRVQAETELVKQVTVNMGRPVIEAAQIPVNLPVDRVIDYPLPNDDPRDVVPQWYADCGLDPRMTCVGMGNPHAVLYCADVSKVPLATVGPLLENLSIFPRRANIHFVTVNTPGAVTMRTWERGSGITLACGSGASAVCVAGALSKRSDRTIVARLPGGELTVEWREADDCVYMTGTANEVFSGEWNATACART